MVLAHDSHKEASLLEEAYVYWLVNTRIISLAPVWDNPQGTSQLHSSYKIGWSYCCYWIHLQFNFCPCPILFSSTFPQPFILRTENTLRWPCCMHTCISESDSCGTCLQNENSVFGWKISNCDNVRHLCYFIFFFFFFFFIFFGISMSFLLVSKNHLWIRMLNICHVVQMKYHLLLPLVYYGVLYFGYGSDSKESACNTGDLGLIPGRGRPLGDRSMATHSNILAWRIPRTEEPSGL